MIREEQIEQAAEDFAGINYDVETESDSFYHHIQKESFIAGAEWADEYPQKKSKWTEDDEELCQDTLDAFEALANDLNPSEDWGKLYDWFKSIKQRMEE